MLQQHQLRLYGLFMAITLCFCLYSLVQERLMTCGFGPHDERFQHSLFVILVNRLVTMAVSAAALALTERSLGPAAPIWVFSVPSLANVLASTSQYEALKYVSFPLQALAKCAKTVPVMAWGLFIGGRSYSKSDYVCSLAVTAGCAIFVLTGSIAAPSISSAAAAAAAQAASASTLRPLPAQQQHWALLGIALLAAFLLFDGLASTSQDRLFHSYKPMHSCNQLLWVTAWSAAFSLAGLVAGGQLAPALAFVARHPPSLGLILALSALSTAAQLFIFYTIQQYGALQFALVMTLRQFLSIVLSCLVFSHHLSPAQWAGTALVIGALVQRAQKKGGARQLKPAMSLEGVAQDEEEGPLLIPIIQMAVSQMGKRLGMQQSPHKPNNISVDVDGRGQHSPANGGGLLGGSTGSNEGDLQGGLTGRRVGGSLTPRLQAAAAVSERRPKSAAQQSDSRPEGRGRGSPGRSTSASLEAVGVRP